MAPQRAFFGGAPLPFGHQPLAPEVQRSQRLPGHPQRRVKRLTTDTIRLGQVALELTWTRNPGLLRWLVRAGIGRVWCSAWQVMEAAPAHPSGRARRAGNDATETVRVCLSKGRSTRNSDSGESSVDRLFTTLSRRPRQYNCDPIDLYVTRETEACFLIYPAISLATLFTRICWIVE